MVVVFDTITGAVLVVVVVETVTAVVVTVDIEVMGGTVLVVVCVVVTGAGWQPKIVVNSVTARSRENIIVVTFFISCPLPPGIIILHLMLYLI